MSSDNANKDTKILTVTKFPHGQQETPRAVRWRDWQRKLLFCFGSHFPMLARQTADPLDPSLPWWGLTWLYDFDSMSAQDEQKVFSEFLKAQYSLLHILTENFYTQEKQLINNHEPIALAKKMKDLYSREWDKTLLKHFPDKDGWTPTEWMSAYIPFGYMCLKALADKYDETGVSDAIAKYDEWEKSKKFNSKDINAWASNVEASFAAWFNVAGENPSYMAAVEIVRGILSSDNEDWRQWAFAFSREKSLTLCQRF